MKIFIHKNGEWIDVLPVIMVDWGNNYMRYYIGWIYWTVEINFKAH